METRKSKRKDDKGSAATTSRSKRSRNSSTSPAEPAGSPPPAGKRPARRSGGSSAAPSPRASGGASQAPDAEATPSGTSAPPEGVRGTRMDREPPNDGGAEGHGMDDEDLAAASLSRNLASASSALHGLLRKLGAGLDDLIPGASVTQSRLKSILVGLRAEGDDERQLESLNSLCEVLSISTEESLAAFSVDSFVPILVGMLNYEHNPDMMLLAARALTHLVEVLPSSSAAVVHYGAVPCFCARLLTIEYIDLAEQSLQALEKLSHDHPGACLRAGGLMAVLSYLDFFATSVQRIAVATAANLCRQLPSDAYELVVDSIPILTNLLQYQDHKVVENACSCLTRLAEAFSGSCEKLDKLCSYGLIDHALRLVSLSESGASTAALSNSTFYGLVLLLSTCAAGSPAVAEHLLQGGVSGTVKAILASSSLLSTSPHMSPSSVLRSADQLFEVLCLVNELMPSMPDASPAAAGVAPISSRALGGRGEAEAAAGDVARSKTLEDNPALVVRFTEDLFALLLQVYGVCVNTPVRIKCLSCIAKLLHFSTAASLETLLRDLAVSSFVANVLASKDSSVAGMGLLMAEILMEKLPVVFARAFLKEGVVHAVDQVVSAVPGSAARSGPGGKPPTGSAAARATRSSSRGSSADGAGASPAPTPEAAARAARAAGGAGASPAPQTPSSGSMRAALAQRAAKFKETHFAAGGGEGALATEGLQRLQALCGALKAATSPEQEAAAIRDLLSTLSGSTENISTFEFVGSGTVAFLRDYLTGADLPKADREVGPDGGEGALVARLRGFVTAATPESTMVGAGEAPPLQPLVRKLQDALGSLERCPVLLSLAPSRAGEGGAGGWAGSSGLSALTQPFKLRLCRAPAERSLRDYSTNIVLIEPLATLGAVEDFLWSRVRRSEAPSSAALAGGAGGASGAAAAAATGGAGAAGSASGDDKGAGGAGGALTRAQAKAAAKDEGGASGSGSGGEGAKGKGKGKAHEASPSDPSTAAAGRSGRRSGGRGGWRDGDPDEMLDEEDLDGPHSHMPHDDDDDEDMDDEDVIGHDDDDEMDYDDEEDEEGLFGEAMGGGGEEVHDVQLGAAEASAAAAAAAASSGGAEGGASSSRDKGKEGKKGKDKKAAPAAGKGAEGSSRGAGAPSAPPPFPSSSAPGATRGAGEATPDRRGYAAAAAAAAAPRLQFLMAGKPLPPGTTIFQAIQQGVAEHGDEEEYEGAAPRCLWDDVYTVTYRRCVEGDPAAAPAAPAAVAAAPEPPSPGGGVSPAGGPLRAVLAAAEPVVLDRGQGQGAEAGAVLNLLHILEVLNRLGWRLLADTLPPARAAGPPPPLARVPREDFQSPKLTPKLIRQLQDVLTLCSGGLPPWTKELMARAPFLFPFDCRRQYFYCTAFGLSRALLRLQQQQTAEGGAAASEQGRELRVGRLQRQKVRVSRSRILDSATKVMELYASHKAVLEVEYFGEVGTGLGPTLEFYTLLSHEMQKAELAMWREEQRPDGSGGKAGGGKAAASGGGADIEMEDGAAAEAMIVGGGDAAGGGGGAPEAKAPAGPKKGSLGVWGEMAEGAGDDFVYAPLGLFPRPLSPAARSSPEGIKVIERFRLLGRVVSKALQDGRMLDIPLAPAFYRLVLGLPLDLHDIRTFDPRLGASLAEMEAAARGGKGGGGGAKLQVRGCDVEDLCLDFTLPGNESYELRPGGGDEGVTSATLHEYVSLVVGATLGDGVEQQAEAFKAGFNQVFPLATLRMFTEGELESMLCGCAEQWTAEGLSDCIKFDHGYTAQSDPVRSLLRVLSELGADDQRRFLRFATGAPRLPPGGVAALQPRLTVVRKQPTGAATGATPGSSPSSLAPGAGTELADNDLPSVMTCANYLKLPPYSCYEVAKERLLFAIREGQGSFDLS